MSFVYIFEISGSEKFQFSRGLKKLNCIRALFNFHGSGHLLTLQDQRLVDNVESKISDDL
ncbi:MAG: hypothetical protein WCG25_06105 [bacterium]